MRNSSPIQLANGGSLGANFNSNGIYLNQTFVYSIQAIWTGASAAGTIQIEISNDNVPPVLYSSLGSPASNPSANVVNWTPYPATQQTVAGAGSFMWNFSDAGYGWVRLNFAYSSGTGLLTVNAWTKGG